MTENDSYDVNSTISIIIRDWQGRIQDLKLGVAQMYWGGGGDEYI